MPIIFFMWHEEQSASFASDPGCSTAAAGIAHRRKMQPTIAESGMNLVFQYIECRVILWTGWGASITKNQLFVIRITLPCDPDHELWRVEAPANRTALSHLEIHESMDSDARFT
jgi:hypothetical protein